MFSSSHKRTRRLSGGVKKLLDNKGGRETPSEDQIRKRGKAATVSTKKGGREIDFARGQVRAVIPHLA